MFTGCDSVQVVTCDRLSQWTSIKGAFFFKWLFVSISQFQLGIINLSQPEINYRALGRNDDNTHIKEWAAPAARLKVHPKNWKESDGLFFLLFPQTLRKFPVPLESLSAVSQSFHAILSISFFFFNLLLHRPTFPCCQLHHLAAI